MPHKILVFGGQELGLAVARRLREARGEFMLIDRQDRLQMAESAGFPVSSIDYTRDSELVSVGIGHGIDLVFCLLDDDAQNVFLTIAIRALGPQVIIIATARDTDTLMKLRAAGADQVIDPQDIVGSSIARLIQHPLATEALRVSLSTTGGLGFQEWPVEVANSLVGQRLEDLAQTLPGEALILGIRDGERFIFRPDYPETLRPGQVVLTLGPVNQDRGYGEATED